MNQPPEGNEIAALIGSKFTIECCAWEYHASSHGWEAEIGDVLSTSNEIEPRALTDNKRRVTPKTSVALKARELLVTRTFLFLLYKSRRNLTTTTAAKLSIPMIYVKELWSFLFTTPSTLVLMMLITQWKILLYTSLWINKKLYSR